MSLFAKHGELEIASEAISSAKYLMQLSAI